MGASDDPRRVHFQSPEHLIDRLDAVADVYDTDRTDLLVDAIREYITETVEDEAFQDLVTSKYYDEQIGFQTVKRVLGTSTANRLRILKASLESNPRDLDTSPTTLLSRNPDGRWTARDLEHGVSAQGETRDAALESLDDVVAALEAEGGRAPTDADLEELGIEPGTNESSDELPDVLDQ